MPLTFDDAIVVSRYLSHHGMLVHAVKLANSYELTRDRTKPAEWEVEVRMSGLDLSEMVTSWPEARRLVELARDGCAHEKLTIEAGSATDLYAPPLIMCARCGAVLEATEQTQPWLVGEMGRMFAVMRSAFHSQDLRAAPLDSPEAK